jgi:NADH-quinone oxidoreductase subunit L
MKPLLVQHLWLIPFLPLLAAAATALLPRRKRRLSSLLAIVALAGSLILSGIAFFAVLSSAGESQGTRHFWNFRWFQAGASWVELGWVLDPLTAVMLLVVCFVGLLIFIYSTAYMAHDDNSTRFFCFLSLFAAAMLGLIISNSLLLLFICWELVGLTSYLLIGFWYHKPSAAAAAKKAFITTRIGDLAFLLGIVWLYASTGTVLFYADGQGGSLEAAALGTLVRQTTCLGMTISSAIALLIFCGAIGKSGQLPLHVWLPDAMEGPTPVSALIHAATMVAAGVFLVARMYPLMSAQVPGLETPALALQVITWVGVITAVFAATIAVAQYDIKRILAYSTVSQLGFMMMGLGLGGVAAGMFHLVTHAFFKALLFLGAGSVIHGCHEEQDIRRMGGLRKLMPVTFITYTLGMLALSGFPLLFSGFWSKDDILHAAHSWTVSSVPFYLGLFGAFLTAFYMMRQIVYVFFGQFRPEGHAGAKAQASIHESPAPMLAPLVVLSACAILLGFLGTPAWPWFQSFLDGNSAHISFAHLLSSETLSTMTVSTLVSLAGLGLGYFVFGRTSSLGTESDPLERMRPDIFGVLHHKYYVDEIYEWSVVRLHAAWARCCVWLDWAVAEGCVQLVGWVVIGLSWVSRAFDEHAINPGFDEGCRRFTAGGTLMSRFQDGRVQRYLRVLGVAAVALVLALLWGCRRA